LVVGVCGEVGGFGGWEWLVVGFDGLAGLGGVGWMGR